MAKASRANETEPNFEDGEKLRPLILRKKRDGKTYLRFPEAGFPKRHDFSASWMLLNGHLVDIWTRATNHDIDEGKAEVHLKLADGEAVYEVELPTHLTDLWVGRLKSSTVS